MSNSTDTYQCSICDYAESDPSPANLGTVGGNTDRYQHQAHSLWRCPLCATIQNVDPVDFEDIYSGYVLDERPLDGIARATYRQLIGRLERAGLQKHHRILDVGCGNGVMIRYLQSVGYQNVEGYDPFVEPYDRRPASDERYDCIVMSDVLEHVQNPRVFLGQWRSQIRAGGLLYVGTVDADGIDDLRDLESETMRLHQPFHRIMINEKQLELLGDELGLEVLQRHQRSYLDTLVPFGNYRFLNDLQAAIGGTLEPMFTAKAVWATLVHPWVFLMAFLGYFMPCANEPARIWKIPAALQASPSVRERRHSGRVLKSPGIVTLDTTANTEVAARAERGAA